MKKTVDVTGDLADAMPPNLKTKTASQKVSGSDAKIGDLSMFAMGTLPAYNRSILFMAVLLVRWVY